MHWKLPLTIFRSTYIGIYIQCICSISLLFYTKQIHIIFLFFYEKRNMAFSLNGLPKKNIYINVTGIYQHFVLYCHTFSYKVLLYSFIKLQKKISLFSGKIFNWFLHCKYMLNSPLHCIVYTKRHKMCINMYSIKSVKYSYKSIVL